MEIDGFVHAEVVELQRALRLHVDNPVRLSRVHLQVQAQGLEELQ